MSAVKGIEIKIPPLVIKENSELECWNDFITRFEVALINTNLAIPIQSSTTTTTEETGESSKAALVVNDSDYRRGGLLLNSIGSDGYKIFSKWKISVRDISYDNLVTRYTAEFTKKQNIFVTRFKFFNMEQLAGETAEEFLDKTTKAASYCALNDLEDDLILQCFTKGIKCNELRKELLSTDECNLAKARKICFTFESAQRTNSTLTHKPESASVGAVGEQKKATKERPKQGPNKENTCHICKSSEHWAYKCPEKKKLKCTTCLKKGHSSQYCRNTVQVVEAKEKEADSDESL